MKFLNNRLGFDFTYYNSRTKNQIMKVPAPAPWLSLIHISDIRADKTYSGVLRRKSTIDSVLTSLQNSIPIDYKIVGSNPGLEISYP